MKEGLQEVHILLPDEYSGKYSKNNLKKKCQLIVDYQESSLAWK